MKTESKVVSFVIFGLLLGEVGSRVFEQRLSADIRQILAFEKIPRMIEETKERGGTSVLVLGNSLARAAVDESILEAGLREQGWPQPEAYFLTPDSTGINEWTAAYRKIFSGSREVLPDLLIIATGPEHLLDHPVRSPEKLAAYHASQGDWARILLKWLTGESERSRFLLASVSRLFAVRERVRPLLFYKMVPGYAVTAQELNRVAGAQNREKERTGASANRFQVLLDSLQITDDRVVVAAVPLPEPYRIPEAVRVATTEWEVETFEEAAGESYPIEAFPDGYHLGEVYAKRFTNDLVDRLRVLRESDREQKGRL